MKILVVGSGGREHALAHKLSSSPNIQAVHIAPGNGGTEGFSRWLVNVPQTDIHALADFVEQERIDFTVVGPEMPLAAGIVDVFRARRLKIFGPTQAAAQLESSKDFAKAFMARHNIPTARYQTFTDAALARAYVAQEGAPIVVKADGLAAGKGVVVAQTIDEANQAIDAMLADNRLGAAGARVVIEQFIQGVEVSFIVMADGTNVLPLATSQDHKRLLNDDMGPNTGGMGAYSPTPFVTPPLHARILREIIKPVIKGMSAEGVPYSGFLYAGIMIDPEGNPYTLEFNCRLGDPEAQVILPRLKSDLVSVLRKAFEGRLDKVELDWDRRVAVGVVIAAPGYPDAPELGGEIAPLPRNTNDSFIYHSGTRIKDKQLQVSGGRVLTAVGLADTLKMAQKNAYDLVEGILFKGAQWRTDIAAKANKLALKNN